MEARATLNELPWILIVPPGVDLDEATEDIIRAWLPGDRDVLPLPWLYEQLGGLHIIMDGLSRGLNMLEVRQMLAEAGLYRPSDGAE